MANKSNIDTLFLSSRAYLARAISHLVPLHAVEDVVQETYVRVCQFKNRDSIRHPRALMTTIARNLALDYLKRADRRLTTSLDNALDQDITDNGSHGQDPLEKAVTDEEFGRLCEAVRQLPQQCRRAFVLKKVYGFTQKEIALQMEISENTVEKHIAKGMKLCAEHMLTQDKVSRINRSTKPGSLPGSLL